MSEHPNVDLATGFLTRFDDSAQLAAEVVAAYVSKVPVSRTELQDLLRQTHATFRGLGEAQAPAAAAPSVDCRQTADAINASITPDALISFIDGAPYKALKRHLSTNGMDPESYREKFGLPSTYPMVCASYSAQRSELAKQLGLGTRTAGHRQQVAA